MTAPAAPDVGEIAALRERLRNAASDMCPYENKDGTILRLKRQRRDAIKVANELLSILAIRQHLTERNGK